MTPTPSPAVTVTVKAPPASMGRAVDTLWHVLAGVVGRAETPTPVPTVLSEAYKEWPDDRPTQKGEERWTRQVRVGDDLAYTEVHHSGSWSASFAEWDVADFGGRGRLRLHYERDSWTLDGPAEIVALVQARLIAP